MTYLSTHHVCCLQQRTCFLRHCQGAGKSGELKGFWKQSRAEMGKRDHNRLLQQVYSNDDWHQNYNRDHQHYQFHDYHHDPDPDHDPYDHHDQDRGGLAPGSNGEDPDNNGQAESHTRRPQSVNEWSLIVGGGDNHDKSDSFKTAYDYKYNHCDNNDQAESHAKRPQSVNDCELDNIDDYLDDYNDQQLWKSTRQSWKSTIQHLMTFGIRPWL